MTTRSCMVDRTNVIQKLIYGKGRIMLCFNRSLKSYIVKRFTKIRNGLQYKCVTSLSDTLIEICEIL